MVSYYRFADFESALKFSNEVSQIANRSEFDVDVEVDHGQVKITGAKNTQRLFEEVKNLYLTYRLDS